MIRSTGHPMRRVLAVAGAAVLVAGAAGCSGSSSSSRSTSPSTTTSTLSAATVRFRRQARDLTARSIVVSSTDPNALQFTDAQARCVAGRLVTGFSRSRLQALGLSLKTSTGPVLGVPPLTQAEADRVLGYYRACMDLRAQLIAFIGQNPGLTTAEVRCIATAYLASPVLPRALFSRTADPKLRRDIVRTITAERKACGAPG